jgi:CRISPR-associated endonuclease/helicase Cas3
MLDDDAVPVTVPAYGPAGVVDGLLADLRRAEGSRREVFRALQPYVVALPRHIADRADVQALMEPVVGDLWQWTGSYDKTVGIDDGDTASQTVW